MHNISNIFTASIRICASTQVSGRLTASIVRKRSRKPPVCRFTWKSIRTKPARSSIVAPSARNPTASSRIWTSTCSSTPLLHKRNRSINANGAISRSVIRCNWFITWSPNMTCIMPALAAKIWPVSFANKSSQMRLRSYSIYAITSKGDRNNKSQQQGLEKSLEVNDKRK